jgi:type IV pilus assembly protein PilQ
MHARSPSRIDARRQAPSLGLRALAIGVALLLCAGHSLALAQQSPPVVSQRDFSTQLGDPATPPAALNVPGAPTPEDPLAAAARAIIGAAGLTGQSPTGPAAPQSRTNPFATALQPGAAAPAGQPAGVEQLPSGNVLVPAAKSDPEKVVVNADDAGLISLMVREGSLRQVIAMIADTQKLNIVFAGPNDVQVTASFDRQPWQTVLDSLLSASGHTWATQDNVIFVASLEQTSFLPPGAEGRRVQVFELDFASAVDVDQTIKGILSPAGESWLVETNKADNRRTREAIAVVDFPDNLVRISDYICQADQPPRQVFIEAHILQVNLDDDCKSGVNFKDLISMSSGRIRLSTAGFATPPVTNTLPTNPLTSASPAFFIEADGTGLDGLIELIQTTTDTKTLASPNIHAVSGQESHIQIGGQLGYRITTTTQTSTMESVQFLDVGVVLRVTPRITRDGRVLMRIFPKVSTGAVDPVTGLPSEETTEIETDVLLNSGQGVVIGGLIQETDNNLVSKIPYLGDIPYLGILFQKRQVKKERQEIIITLRPHVLPYSPILLARHEHEIMRAETPLTQGAIGSYPRPYEPRLPDAMFHNKHHQGKVAASVAEAEQLYHLPPVDPAVRYAPVEPLPFEAWDQHQMEELPLPTGEVLINPALKNMAPVDAGASPTNPFRKAEPQ